VCSVPCAGQLDNGDAAWLAQGEQLWRALLVDASGHGAAAHRLCQRIADSEVFRATGELANIMQHLHDVLAGTAGAAAMIADVHWQGTQARLRYVGVGNIRLWVDGREGLSDEGQPGLLGSRFPAHLTVRERLLYEGDRLALVSDGVRSSARQQLSSPASGVQDLAAQLVHGHARRHDDATCVLLCLRRPS
jgi:hypothetical protein